jgi:hypothetical protein
MRPEERTRNWEVKVVCEEPVRLEVAGPVTGNGTFREARRPSCFGYAEPVTRTIVAL